MYIEFRNKFLLLISILILNGSAVSAQNFSADTLWISLDNAIEQALTNNEKLLSAKTQIEKSNYAIAVIGGLGFSLFVTLLLLPNLYMIFSKDH